MSDSISKYHELVEDGVIDPNVSYEQKRENQILALLARAAKAGKSGEVERRAFEVQREFGSTSLLLGLQVAVDELLEDGE